MAHALTHSLVSDSLATAIRTHFSLTQAELADYLEVSSGYVAHLEAGRKQPAPATTLRLLRLARLLPPPEGTGPAAPPEAALSVIVPPDLLNNTPLALGPLAPGPLQKRQRQCTRRLALVQRDLYVLTDRLARHARRRWALPVLELALVPDPADPAADDPAERTHLRGWLDGLAATLPVAPAQRPDPATALALLLVRRAALEAEAATLARLVAEGS